VDIIPHPYEDVRRDVLGPGVAPLPGGAELGKRLCYPVDPESRLYLLGAGFACEPQVAAALLSTWRQIPTEDRRKIAAFWRSVPMHAEHLTQEWAPEVTLATTWFTRGEDNEATTLGGYVFLFHEPTVRSKDARYAETLIAHELAHALQRATGVWGQESPKPPLSQREKEDLVIEKMRWPREQLGIRLIFQRRTLDQLVAYLRSDDEKRTDEIMRRWGFDPALLNA
jgi:hypothetical protein